MSNPREWWLSFTETSLCTSLLTIYSCVFLQLSGRASTPQCRAVKLRFCCGEFICCAKCKAAPLRSPRPISACVKNERVRRHLKSSTVVRKALSSSAWCRVTKLFKGLLFKTSTPVLIFSRIYDLSINPTIQFRCQNESPDLFFSAPASKLWAASQSPGSFLGGTGSTEAGQDSFLWFRGNEFQHPEGSVWSQHRCVSNGPNPLNNVTWLKPSGEVETRPSCIHLSRHGHKGTTRIHAVSGLLTASGMNSRRAVGPLPVLLSLRHRL